MKRTIPSISTFTDPAVTAPFDPVSSPSQTVAYWLRRDIVRGVFPPLTRLKVESLVKFYGIGHSPVREAILRLSTSGLVSHEYQRGYSVAAVSLADYDDVLSVYQRLYKLALTMAMDLAGDEWEEKVVVGLHRNSKAPSIPPGGDPQARERSQRAYAEFHGELLSGCGSPLLLGLLGDIGSRLERYVNLFADLASDRDLDHHAEHRQIVEAALARDRERALGLIERYFASAQPMRDTIIAALKRGAAEGPRRRRRPALERGRSD